MGSIGGSAALPAKENPASSVRQISAQKNRQEIDQAHKKIRVDGKMPTFVIKRVSKVSSSDQEIVQKVEQSPNKIFLTPESSPVNCLRVVSPDFVDDFTFDQCLDDGFTSPLNPGINSSQGDKKSIDELFEEIKEFVEAKEEFSKLPSPPVPNLDWEMENLESFESLIQDQNESKLLSSTSPIFNEISVEDCYRDPKIELHSFYDDSDYESLNSPESDSSEQSPVGLDLFPGLF